MPLDREATLKTAEKLLRQGKLEAAIAEYQKVIEDQPRDWNTANTLGDLLLRAGKTDKAVAQFARSADHLASEGFLPKAIALYKKIIKIKPDDERALMRAADISADQGLVAEAKAYLTTIAEHRRGRGDRRGAAEIRVKLGAIDPDDLEARLAGARANAEIGETLAAAAELRHLAQAFADRDDHRRMLDLLQEAGALNPADPEARRLLVQGYIATGELNRLEQLAVPSSELKVIAADLREQGRQESAIAVLAAALRLEPTDDEARDLLMRAHVAAGNIDAAVALAMTPPWLRQLAAELMRRGHEDRALDLLGEVSRLEPADEGLKTDLARAFVRRGDLERAARYLTREAAGQDPTLLLIYADIELRHGNTSAALAAMRTALEHAPEKRDEVLQVAWRIRESDADAAFQCIDLVSDAAVAAGDWTTAAGALRTFLERVPTHVPALMKLVEICVDGGLETQLYEAQAQLADAYLRAGLGSEARVIAEELVAREPWDRTHLDRFRRALALLGEPDPDGVIAERLGGQTPFMSTEIGRAPDTEEFAVPETGNDASARGPLGASSGTATPAQASKGSGAQPASYPADGSGRGPAAPVAPPSSTGERTFQLGPVAIDWTSILGETSERNDKAGRGTEAHEVDLSGVLDGLRLVEPSAAGGAMDQKPGDGSVFQEFRDEVTRQTALDAAEQHFKLGQTYRDMGMLDDAIAEFQKAARSPRRRFEAASIVARMFTDRGNHQQAIEWFERAAEAPAPTVDAGRALLYDFATALESNNDTRRALTLLTELKADAGDYRDVRARVDRLTKAQARG